MALFSRIPDPLKKAKDPADPDLHHWIESQNFKPIGLVKP